MPSEVIGAGKALRLGGRAAARAPELVALRVVVELFSGLAGAAPVALLALGVAARLAPGELPRLLDAARPLSVMVAGLGGPETLLPLSGLALVAFFAATMVRLLYLGGAVAALADDVAQGERPTFERFGVRAAERFERMVLFAPVALAGALGAALWAGGVGGAGLVVFASRPSAPAALAAALGLALATGVILAAGVLGRLCIVRVAVHGDGPGMAVWNAAVLLWRAPLPVIVALAVTALSDLMVGSIGLFGLVPPGGGAGAVALSLGALGAAGLLQLALGAFVDLWRWGALVAISAAAEGRLPAPPAPQPAPPAPVEAVLVTEAVEVAPPRPSEPEKAS